MKHDMNSEYDTESALILLRHRINACEYKLAMDGDDEYGHLDEAIEMLHGAVYHLEMSL